MSILDTIVAETRNRVEADKIKGVSFNNKTYLESFAFEKALKEKGMSFICEVKKASPSKGIIAEDFPYIEIAKDYEKAGAAAISVLTEPKFFLGSDEYLAKIRKNVNIPIIRKDFVVDAFQIDQAADMGADAVLLIAAVLSENKLREFIKLADSFGLSALVEVHDEKELESAINAGARIIGVNNRNLHDFSVDTGNSVRLRKLAPKETVFVSESGIKTADDIKLLNKNGVNAVLVGETLMKSKDKKAALEKLRGDLR